MADHLPGIDFLSHAIAYAGLNFSIIPIKPQSKKSAVGWKTYQTRKATPEEIQDWWDHNPQRNIAAVTGAVSNIVVIDIDPRKGGSIDALKELGVTDDDLNTVTCRTGGSGLHIYYRHPGKYLPSAILSNGIDLKGDGGYVVLPPSRHPGGTVYQWVPGKGLGEVVIKPLPSCILEYLSQSKQETVQMNLAKPTDSEVDAAINYVWDSLSNWAKHLIKDTFPVQQSDSIDRSGSAFELAKLIIENTGIADPRTIALVVYGSQVHKAKFGKRRDEWEDACRVAQRAVGSEKSSEAAQPQEPEKAKSLIDLAVLYDKWLWDTPQVEPLWEGILYRGMVHLLAAPPKTGKSTFLADLLMHLTWPLVTITLNGSTYPLNKGCYLGFNHVTNCSALLITEEAPYPWQNRAPLGHNVWVVSTKNAKDHLQELPQIIEDAEFDLVIIDTVDKVLNIRDENDNAAINRALEPIMDATHNGKHTAVILVHHHRKGGGSSGDEIRGGTAFLGSVDVYIRLSRTLQHPQGREIAVIGRMQHPTEPIEIYYSNGSYEVIDTNELTEQEKEVIRVLSGSDDPLTQKELGEILDFNVKKALDSLIAKKLIHRERGGQNKPYQYGICEDEEDD